MTSTIHEGDSRPLSTQRLRFQLRLSWDDGDAQAYAREISTSSLTVETDGILESGATVRFEGQIGQDLRWETISGQGRIAPPVEGGDTRGAGGAVVQIEVEEFFQGRPALEVALARPPDEPPPGADGSEGEERRAAPRFRVGIPVRWGEARPLHRTGFMTHVSAAGAFVLATEAPLPQGTPIRLSFELPTGDGIVPATADAVITRIAWGVESEGYGLGISFDRSNDPASVLTDFLLTEIDAAQGVRVSLAGEEPAGAPVEEEPEDEPTAEPTAEPAAKPATPVPGTALSARKPGAEKGDDPSGLLESLTQTLAGGGSFRLSSMTKILLFGMLASFFLYLVHNCMSAFE